MHQALSIIHLTCHHHNAPQPERGSRRGPASWNSWGVNGVNFRKENRAREDDRWWARMGWKGRRGARIDDEEAEVWQAIVAEGVTEMVGRRKDEQALIFYTRWFLYTWREVSDSKVSFSPSSFCHCLYLVSTTSRCGQEWKANLDLSKTQREAQWERRAN